ncbi:MAG: hypothetical protein IJK01_06640 [Clostridia bacterium]|nr:hypothetical protein [Clostridia bacterium]MBR0425780.1 hypothetical protein [Clostridia bacterium]
MKHNRIIALLLTLVLCILCTACSPEALGQFGERMEDTAANAAETAAVVTESETTSVPVPSEDRQTDKAMQDLVEKTMQCVRSRDKAGFSDLFVDTDAATVDLWWNNFCTAVDYCGGAEHVDTTIVTRTEKYYVVGLCFYTVTGVSPNSKVFKYFGAVMTQYENGKAAYTNQSDEIYQKVRPGMENALFNALGEEGTSARSAMESGRNFTAFAYNWMFLDPDFSFLGHYNTPEPLYVWQEENGDVKMMLWSANGLENSMSSYDTVVTLTDMQHGTVFDGSVDVTIPLLPHRNGFRVVTIPADQIQTGTQAWTTLQQRSRSHY